jgi:hypothetical protein
MLLEAGYCYTQLTHSDAIGDYRVRIRPALPSAYRDAQVHTRQVGGYWATRTVKTRPDSVIWFLHQPLEIPGGPAQDVQTRAAHTDVGTEDVFRDIETEFRQENDRMKAVIPAYSSIVRTSNHPWRVWKPSPRPEGPEGSEPEGQ